jgi:hypothetical protein
MLEIYRKPGRCFDMLKGESQTHDGGKQTFMRIYDDHDTGSVVSECITEECDPTNGTSDYTTRLEMVTNGDEVNSTVISSNSHRADLDIGTKSDTARRALKTAV